jgi:hypothetical protein
MVVAHELLASTLSYLRPSPIGYLNRFIKVNITSLSEKHSPIVFISLYFFSLSIMDFWLSKFS